MNENIKDLWLGNIDPQNSRMTNAPEMKQIMGFIARHREALCQGMSEEQLETLEKLDDCLAEYNCLVQEAIFVYAYRLGARLVLDTLTDDG
jgi:hypothetical protein